MTVAYWILASLLAAFYLWSGGMKVVQSRDQMRPIMPWVDDVRLVLVRAIGLAEVLGALGLLLPRMTGIAPGLAISAAVGLTLLQILALGFHLVRGETRNLWLNVVLIALGIVTVWLAAYS